MDTMHERIGALLTKRGMTHHDLAEAIGLERTKLTKSLNGRRQLGVAETAAISDVLGVDMLWLSTGSPSVTGMGLAMRHAFDQSTGAYLPPAPEDRETLALVDRAYRLAADEAKAKESAMRFEAFRSKLAPADDPGWDDVRRVAGQVGDAWRAWVKANSGGPLLVQLEGFLETLGIDLVVVPSVHAGRAQTWALTVGGHHVLVVPTSTAWYSVVYGAFHEMAHFLYGHVGVPTGVQEPDKRIEAEKLANGFAADALVPLGDARSFPGDADCSVYAQSCWEHFVGAATMSFRLGAAKRQVEVWSQPEVTDQWDRDHSEEQAERSSAFETMRFPKWLVERHRTLVAAGTIRPDTLAEMVMVPVEDLEQPGEASVSDEVQAMLDQWGV